LTPFSAFTPSKERKTSTARKLPFPGGEGATGESDNFVSDSYPGSAGDFGRGPGFHGFDEFRLAVGDLDHAVFTTERRVEFGREADRAGDRFQAFEPFHRRGKR